ncbi:MAG: class I SAM-dependent methyltransferase [Terriglobales bacterium]
MAERAWIVEDALASRTLKLLELLLGNFHLRDFAIELWDGTRWAPEKNQFQRFTWKINHPSVLKAAISSSNRQVALARAYVNGGFDIEGDIEGIFPLADYLIHKQWTTVEKLHLTAMALGLPSRHFDGDQIAVHISGRVHSKTRDRQAIRYHYDVSNDFYSLWLDQNMAYSCAYFQTSSDDIDTAQRQKFDYTCRKLRLKPGERLLDIGCGWGGLIMHAAREFRVHATGITLSQQQFEFADRRIRELGLSNQCEVRLIDYRDLNAADSYDKIVSVGMVEHVGESKLPEYFQQAFRMLRASGVFLNVGIGRAGNRPPDIEPAFTDAYIFPDSELVSIGNMLTYAEQGGFEVRDVENLREHYCLTTKRWLRRLEAHAVQAQAIAGEIKYRMWRLYLAGSAYYFQKGLLDLYQTLLVKNERGCNHLPLTRQHWYSESKL